MATYDIVQQTYNVGTETAPVWRPWYGVTVAEAVKMGADNEQTIVQYISQRFSDLMGEGVPDTFDTIKEIYDYIQEHEEVATALNTAIANKVDKVDGKGLSTNDLTNELMTKLETAYGSSTYTNATPTPVKHGGIAAGTTFENASVNSIINDILYGYAKPNANITISLTTTDDLLTNTNGGSLYYNGDTGEEKYGNSPFVIPYFTGRNSEFTITAIVHIANKPSDYVPTITFSVDRGQTITTTQNESGQYVGIITPTAPATVSISVTDEESTTKFAVVNFNNIAPVAVLNSHESYEFEGAVTEADIETVIGKESYDTDVPYKMTLRNYNNRRIAFIKQGNASAIYDKNGLDITRLFATTANISVDGITSSPITGTMYISDPITVDNFYIEIY